MPPYKTIGCDVEDRVARVTFNRPEVHNAFNDTMIHELSEVFDDLNENDEVRVVVVSGAGKSFCAGADLNWMRRVREFTFEDNLRESLELADMLAKVYSSKKPTIARVNGAAIGGGTGLVAVCDIAVAAASAKFSFSEVKLGLIPACISPYVMQKCGHGRCREFFLTGERLTAEKALHAGLVNTVVPLAELDEAITRLVRQLLTSGPEAIRTCKTLLHNVAEMPLEQAKKYTAEVIAQLRVSAEGQEGMNAFLEKRKPKWATE
jgi:methylglutaconyl-CoA hydratase